LKRDILFFLILFVLCNLIYSEEFNTIKVQKGETLWSLAQKYFNDPLKWQILANINNIENPHHILTGIEIKIPVDSSTIQSLSKTEIRGTVKRRQTEIKESQEKAIIPSPEKITKVDTEQFLELKEIPKDGSEIEIAGPKGIETPYKEKKATITYIKGSVKLKNNIQRIWITLLKPGAPLYKQDMLETDENSVAMVSFEDGSYIKLLPNSSITLNKTEYDKVENSLITIVELNFGKIEANIRPVSPIKPNFKIASKKITADGKGKFNIGKNKEQDLFIEVIDGEVKVQSENQQLNITSGNGAFIAASEMIPSKAEKLLPPPALVSPPDKVYVKSSIPEFQFADVEKAVKYKIQIAKDETFNVIVLEDEYITGTKYKSKALLDGYYYWRVASINANGLCGNFSKPRVIKIDTTSPRIVILSPAEDEIIKTRFARIKCTTEPNYSIKINQYIYYPDKKGEIDVEAEFPQGTNVVLFSVTDEAGNITNLYRTFHMDYYNQIITIDNNNYTITDKWYVNIFNAAGQVIMNDRFYEVEFGRYQQEVEFSAGNNHLILSLENIGYKDMLFIYDFDKPILKQLRIQPLIKDDIAYLNIFLKAEDKTSRLAKKAELVLEEYANISNRYFVELVYSDILNEYQGVLQVRPQVLNKELSIASIKVKDIIGNQTEISSGSFEQPSTPSDFWTKVKTDYNAFKVKKGIPVFLLSATGLLLLL